MTSEGLRVLVIRTAYAVALVAAVGWAFLLVWVSVGNGTLGYDFKAYDLAVDRLLAGQPLYDPNATSEGAFGLFFYPPTFAVLVLPLTLLPTGVGVWLWTLALVASALVAIAIIPVSPRTKLVILLLAAFSWPLVYAIKLGQVGPVLLLLFAIGWRWLDRQWLVGATAALGAAIKVQPVLVLGWAVLTGRVRGALVGLGLLAVIAVVATAIAGPRAWFDEADLLVRVSKPLTPNGVGLGRVLFEAGVPESVATLANIINVVGVAAVALIAALRAAPVAGYLAVVVATQFLSPVLWDHYALILLLPVAWLFDRGRVWAALIPLVTATVLAGVTPKVAYPAVFWLALLAVTWEGIVMRRTETLRAQGNEATGILAV